jgi:YegS/Rv2252/BmrU family lipid kinase
MRKGWLIYNPAAGRFPAGWLLDRAIRVLAKQGWEMEVHETSRGQDLASLATKAVASDCEVVFVAGGDGSVGQVAGQLIGTSKALGVFPAGTANVWAKEIGLRQLDWSNLFALEKAAERLAQGVVREVDIGVANRQSFLLWAGVGLDGSIVNGIEPRERWEKAFGALHYAILALWKAIEWQGQNLEVEANGKLWQGHFLVAIASNIQSYAGGYMRLTPDAKIDDGLLDFWLIGGESLKDAVPWLAHVLLGNMIEAKGVIHFKATQATFRSDGELIMQFDGEPKTFQSPVLFDTRPKALKVLIPEGTKHVFVE